MAYGRRIMARNIVIYQDEGASEFCVAALQAFFGNETTLLCDARDVIAGDVFATADMFVMPGGADLPYSKKLNGEGNRNIRSFVENGGTYLGICAGAYYACRNIEFHKGRSDEICEPRELALVDTTAYGSLPELAPWYDCTLNSAAIITVNTRPVLYYGGCAFRVSDAKADIIARYDALPGNPPAMICKTVGKGRVLLSGVHFEIGPEALSKKDCKAEEEAARQSLCAAISEDQLSVWKRFVETHLS